MMGQIIWSTRGSCYVNRDFEFSKDKDLLGFLHNYLFTKWKYLKIICLINISTIIICFIFLREKISVGNFHNSLHNLLHILMLVFRQFIHFIVVTFVVNLLHFKGHGC